MAEDNKPHIEDSGAIAQDHAVAANPGSVQVTATVQGEDSHYSERVVRGQTLPPSGRRPSCSSPHVPRTRSTKP